MLQEFMMIGRYELGKRLSPAGEGTFGVVYRAHDTVLDEEVALKVLKPPRGGFDTSGGFNALRAEVRPLVSLSHPNVIKYQNCDCAQRRDGTQIFYIAMEYADQGPISEQLKNLTVEVAVAWCEQILKGVAECHRHGIVHADLKPANIFLADGTIKIGDFGAASWGSIPHRRGTPLYNAPEQLAFPPHTSRLSDLWAVGVMLYQMVYGLLPFSSEAEIITPDFLPEFPSTLDFPRLANVIRKAIAKPEAARFQSADLFLDALQTSVRTADTQTFDDALLFYDRYSGCAEVYKLDAGGSMDLLRRHQWSSNWDYLVNWSLPTSPADRILFGQSTSGHRECYCLNSSGDIVAGSTLGPAEDTWTHVVPIESEWGAQVLAYSAYSNCGEVSSLGESDAFAKIRRYVGWSVWSHILPVRLANRRLPWVLFYDAESGRAEFYEITGEGNLLLRKAHNWSRTWSQIVPILGRSGNHTVLLFYDLQAQRGEFYRVTEEGDICLLNAYDGWRKTWARILPLSIKEPQSRLLLFYDASEGYGEFYRLEENCGMTLLAARPGWSPSWSHILPVRTGCK